MEFEIRELNINDDLKTYSEMIGELLTHLSPKADGTAVDLDALHEDVRSPSVLQLIAHDCRQPIGYRPLVGIATLTKVSRRIDRPTAYLEDFVTHPDARGSGLAQQMWDFMNGWRQENDCPELNFSSGEHRVAAHGFYLKNGCTIDERQTTRFKHVLP